MSERLDASALKSGALVCLVFAIPFSLGARWAADSRNDDGLAIALTLAALAGFAIGSGVAAWVQTKGLPLLHGLVTASGTYLAAQTVFIIARLVTGRDVHWFAALFNVTPALFAGLIGGVLGMVLQRRGAVPGRSSGSGPQGGS